MLGASNKLHGDYVGEAEKKRVEEVQALLAADVVDHDDAAEALAPLVDQRQRSLEPTTIAAIRRFFRTSRLVDPLGERDTSTLLVRISEAERRADELAAQLKAARDGAVTAGASTTAAATAAGGLRPAYNCMTVFTYAWVSLKFGILLPAFCTVISQGKRAVVWTNFAAARACRPTPSPSSTTRCTCAP